MLKLMKRGQEEIVQHIYEDLRRRSLGIIFLCNSGALSFIQNALIRIKVKLSDFYKEH